MRSATPMPPFRLYRENEWEELGRNVITETPVSLTVNGEPWLTLMCTPTGLDALAVGFLFNEGIIKHKDEISLVQISPGGERVDVWLNHPVVRPVDWRRTSGCTGGSTAVVAEDMCPEPGNRCVLYPETIHRLIEELTEAQVLYREVGGVHTSILSDGEGKVIQAEDVGRHNSIDKLAGHMVLDDIKLTRIILVTTGRISSEMLQKAARLGASLVVSRSSATSLSIRLAYAWGITLIGYARREQFIVYTHPERIMDQQDSLSITPAEGGSDHKNQHSIFPIVSAITKPEI